jgi:hypothetical protein
MRVLGFLSLRSLLCSNSVVKCSVKFGSVKFGYEENIQSCKPPVTFISTHPIRHSSHFSGTTLSDTALSNAKSKTLVVGDHIYNFPKTESMPTYKPLFWKSLSPSGSVHTKLVNGATKDRAFVHADAKTAVWLIGTSISSTPSSTSSSFPLFKSTSTQFPSMDEAATFPRRC